MGVIETHMADNGATIINASTVALGPIGQAVRGQLGQGSGDQALDYLSAAMASWVNGQEPQGRQMHNIFHRDQYVSPDNPIEQMRTARKAVEDDDVVGGAADVTEGLAMASCSVFCEDLDDESIWNQIIADLDFDSRLREAWRLLYTDSQFVCAMWWDWKTYKTEVPTKKTKGRKTKRLYVPRAMTFLDTTRVAPIGVLTFGMEQLAYIAESDEAPIIDAILASRDGLRDAPGRSRQSERQTIQFWGGPGMGAQVATTSGLSLDENIVRKLIIGKYTPSETERSRLAREGIATDNLYLFDPRYVWRHTRTRLGSAQRFSSVRLKSVFELLDIKRQLRGLERAHLLGSAQYIVLITLGSDQQAAKQDELAHLRANVETIGQIPIIVGDHRLKIEIITPNQQFLLQTDRWDTLDTRIQARCYRTFAPTGKDGDDPIKLGRVIGKGMESERRMIRRAFEANIFEQIRRSNEKSNGDDLLERAVLEFPTIALSFDSAWASFILDLREANDLSRETTLHAIEVQQSREKIRRERERDNGDDDVFQTRVAHGQNFGPDGQPAGQPGQGPLDPMEARRVARREGRRKGGAAPGSGQGQESTDPRRSDTGPRRVSASIIDSITEKTGLDLHDATVDEFTEWLGELERPDLIAIAGVMPTPVTGRHRMRIDPLIEAITDQLSQEDPDDA